MNGIFNVSLKGLANLLPTDRGLGWIATELVQNAWDQTVTQVSVTLDRMEGERNRCKIIVEDDDPEGFLDLSHSFTLFAKSYKLGNVEKRGRFNLGEKLVIAYCVAGGGHVTIQTTSGGFHFSKDGRKRLRRKRESGSKIEAVFRCTLEQFASIERMLGTLIPPTGFPTTVNGEPLPERTPVASATETLPTVIEGEEGQMRRSRRQTLIRMYAPLDGEEPTLYEMGIPVVASGTPYHVDVQQKVPLNFQRDNVTPLYQRKLAVYALNATHDLLTKEQASEAWVSEAMADEEITEDSLTKVLDEKYGEDRLVHDPNNPEASAIGIARGWTIIHGGNESKAAWENIRGKAPVTSAGTKFETDSTVRFDGDEDCSLPESQWTAGMRDLAQFSQTVYKRMFGDYLHISYLNDPRGYGACFSKHHLYWNYRRIGKRRITNWRSKTQREWFIDTLIHEFAHREGSSHFSENFWKATTKIGSKLAILLAEDPTLLNTKGERQ